MPKSQNNDSKATHNSPNFDIEKSNDETSSNQSVKNPVDTKSLMQESDNMEWIEGKQDNSKTLFVFTAIALLLLVGFWAYLYFSNVQKQSQLATLNTQFDELEDQINLPEISLINQTATRLTGGLKTLNKLVSNQVFYSDFFTQLDKATPTDVVMQNISIDKQNKVTMSANAPSLDESAKFIKSLKNLDFLSNFILNGDNETQIAGNKYYNVSMSMTLDPNLLKSKQMGEQ